MKNIVAILVGSTLIAAVTAVSLRTQLTVAMELDSTPVLTRIDRWTGHVSICRWSVVPVRTDAPSKEELEEETWRDAETLREQAELEKVPSAAHSSDNDASRRIRERVERRAERQATQEREGLAKVLPPAVPPKPKYEMKAFPACKSFEVG